MSKEQKYEKGPLITSGKTKNLYEVVGHLDLCIVSSNNDITAHDDPQFTKKFASKAESSNNTTCNVFELLTKAGIPNSFVARYSDTEFVAKRCEMIPLEVIARRHYDGSILKRYPHLRPSVGENPLRSSHLIFELFLKTTEGQCVRDGFVLIEDIPVEDPFILDPYASQWQLRRPKRPPLELDAKDKVALRKQVPKNVSNKNLDFILSLLEPDLGITIDARKVLQGTTVSEIEEITRKVFLLLEGALKILGYRYIDFKIEFGICPITGDLYVSDVIDNDSGRTRNQYWEDFSKQAFRDGEELSAVEKKYLFMSQLSNSFPSVPKQTIVLWRGSPSDDFPEIPDIPGITVEQITLSAHKKPGAVLEKLNQLQAEYPQGGIIVGEAGMSNGLGPTLSAQTTWPVISCPPGIDEHPEDIWSSTRLPSNVPASTVVNPKNAVLHALNILAMQNPIAYMHRQYAMEQVVNQ